MFELRHAEKEFIDMYPETEPLFRDGYLEAAFSDSNTIEIIPTQQARRLGRLVVSLYRRAKLI